MNIKRPHDSFFKQLMSDPEAVKDFLKGFLPQELSNRIDFDSLKIIDTEKTDKKYRKFYLDLSVQCDLSGTESEIYIVFEHKSYADRFTLIQILNYCSVVWEACLKNREPLKPIIPIIFYHGRQRCNLPLEFADYFDVDDVIREYLLNFKTVLFDINRQTDEEILQACSNFYLAASLLAMKHIFRDVDSLKPVFKHIVQLDRDHFLMVLQYVIMTKDINEEEFEELIREAGGEAMPSLAQKWIEQGMQKGMQQGIQKGMQQGMEQGMLEDAREMVIDALDTKFGNYPPHFRERIIQISDRDKLKKIFRLVLKIQSVEELENDKIWN